MAAKKKKKPPGGATGAPPKSEPRVQIFSKFAGCNFQLSTRDPDKLFEADQDAQTDLMPMLMAIQNNAGIVPMGGIETRQALVKIFDRPTGTNRELTGVATLVGERLFVASKDMTVHHGTLTDGTLEDSVTITDSNNSYGALTKYSVAGTVT